MATLLQIVGKAVDAVGARPARRAETFQPPPRRESSVEVGDHNSVNRKKGYNFAGCVHAIAASQVRIRTEGVVMSPSEIARKRYGPDHVVTRELGRSEKRTKDFMAAGDAETGGLGMPATFQMDFYELLREQEVFEQTNPRHQEMSNGRLELPFVKSGTQARHLGEGERIEATGMTFGMRTMRDRKVASFVPRSREFVHYSPQADEMLRDDLLQAAGTEMERGKIRGIGANAEPKGVRTWAAEGGLLIPASDAAGGIPSLRKDLGKMRKALRVRKKGNVMRPAFIGGIGFEQYLLDATDTKERQPYKEDAEKGRLNKSKFVVSDWVPEALGVGGDESELILFDAFDCVVGDVWRTRVEVSTEASFSDGNQFVSSFENDMALIKVISYYDLGMRYDSVVVLVGHRYGAE